MKSIIRETLTGAIVVLALLAVGYLIGAAAVLWVMRVAEGMGIAQ